MMEKQRRTFPFFLFSQFQVLLELSSESTGFQVIVTFTVSGTMHLPRGRDPGEPAWSGPGMDGARLPERLSGIRVRIDSPHLET